MKTAVRMPYTVSGDRQSFLQRPPTLKQALVERGHRDPNFPRPFRQGSGSFPPCNPPIGSGVVRLLNVGGPSDVPRLVVPVVVDPVKRVSQRRTWTYGAEKGGKVVQPFVAHPDSAPAIVRPSLVSGVRTTHLGSTPRMVLRRPRQSMCPLSGGRQFRVQATTTLGVAASKTPSRHPRTSSTSTKALPYISFVDVTNGCEAPERLAGEVDKFSSHLGLIIHDMRYKHNHYRAQEKR
jgi:hypothetical protein